MIKQREALIAAQRVIQDQTNKISEISAAEKEALSLIEDALAEPAREPVAWLSVDFIGERYLCFSEPDDVSAVPLYTAPPAHKPLTDSEILNMAADYYEGYGFRAIEFTRGIERALGIGVEP